MKKLVRNKYGQVVGDPTTIVNTVFPDLDVAVVDKTGCWGGDPSMKLKMNVEGRWTLEVSEGVYKSNKHYHRHSWAVRDLDENEKLVLLEQLHFSNDFTGTGSMPPPSRKIYLLGQNEDGSYFLHRVRPKAGDRIRDAVEWMFSLKKGEKIAARQGDIAFIARDRMPKIPKKAFDTHELRLGRHVVYARGVQRYKSKIYVVDPTASHPEHPPITLEGVYEVRVAKAWSNGGVRTGGD